MSQDYQGYDPVQLGLTVKHSAGIDNVLCACPWHGGSDSLCVNLKTGQFVCYACGEKGGPGKLTAKTGGMPVWTTFQRPSKSEQELQWRKLLDGDLAFDNEYLVDRKVTNYQIEKYGIRENSKGVIIPLTALDGTIVGAIIRRREGKLRYMALGEKPPLWPLHDMVEYPPGFGVAIVEGIFGVLSADRGMIPALATLGANIKKSALPYLQLIQPWVMFDADLAGWVGTYKILKDHPNAFGLVRGVEADELTVDQWQMDFWGAETRGKWAHDAHEYLQRLEVAEGAAPNYILQHAGHQKQTPKVWNYKTGKWVPSGKRIR